MLGVESRPVQLRELPRDLRQVEVDGLVVHVHEIPAVVGGPNLSAPRRRAAVAMFDVRV